MSLLTDPPAAACPVPANEAERLQATRAYQILDTPPDVQFDAITRVASGLFQTPVALIALMDEDRLWFKSKLGVDLPELDRSLAFCAYAIMSPRDLMVVEDLRADPRFADHALVAGGPQVRFYASAPLLAPGDLPVGTIAILDVKPREFSAAEGAALQDLSVAVMTALEGHKRALELSRLATTDYLTGASNRASFEMALQRMISQCADRRDRTALLCMDLDKFKEINDSLGHAAGDTVLRAVSQRLHNACRPGDLIARVGGDEFMVLLAPGADTHLACSVAQRILQRMEDPIVLPSGKVIQIGGSIGIASFPEDGPDPRTLLERADHALYAAKAQAGQRWATATQPLPAVAVPSRPPASVRAGSQDDDPDAGLESIEKPFPFSMAFQPIIDIKARRVFAYEALVRGPGGEPSQEVLDKVTLRNRYAFDQSSRVAAIELAVQLGVQRTGAYLAINFSPAAVQDPRHGLRSTLETARRIGFPLNRLIFEVTRSDEDDDMGRLGRIFEAYQEHGLMTAFDDFGSGGSGLSRLAHCQPRILKLDMALVRNVHGHAARAAIAHGVQLICQKLGIDVIAEGVESWEEHEVLEGLGFRLFQGFLYAEPAFEALPPVPCLSGPVD